LADNKKKAPDSAGSLSKNVNNILNSLTKLSKRTNFSTYGTSKDLYDTERLLTKLDDISKKDEQSLSSTVQGSIYNNARINSFGITGRNRIQNGQDKKDNKNIYGPQSQNIFDIISSNKNMFMELKNQILMNDKLYETLSDYEVFRRAIPQVSRVINLLLNSIVTPEAITSEIFSLEYSIESEAKKSIAAKIKDKYELNLKVKTIVENYLVIGMEYITVVPYRSIVEAIKQDQLSTTGKSDLVRESALIILDKDKKKNPSILTEASVMDAFEEKLQEKFKAMGVDGKASSLSKLNESVNEYISNIKVYKSNKKMAYDAALVEAVMNTDGELLIESSYDEMMDSVPKIKTNNSNSQAAEGLLNATNKSDYDKLQILGCKIERLDPARVWPLRIKDTTIAYIYIEERRDESLRMNLRGNFQQNFSFYKASTNDYNDQNMKMIENQILRSIGNSVLSNISPKFLEANFDNMDVLYEFLRDRQIHKEARDIIILHPDDVIEFRRQQGSIMKDALFFLKLYMLLILSNILTKVRKGSDRTVWSVSNGLSNDIEESVMEAIEAVQQSQVRWSDVGTISGIIGSVGSVVDLFVPQSQDGEQPIKPEVISGQQVDMDEPFLQFLMKSIILSFNVPSVIVDFAEEVEFAKTLSMANLDIASSSAHAQAELNTPLTKLLRHIMAYELDLTKDEIESVHATLIPSRSMLMQITNELLNTIKDLGTSMADTQVPEDDELLKKLFVQEFVRDNLTYDWDHIDGMIKNIREKLVKEGLRSKIKDAVSTDGTQTTDGTDSASGV
jgi:hypothetical protein